MNYQTDGCAMSYRTGYDAGYAKGHEDGYNAAKAESRPVWTPCAEGMPTEDGKYWVTFMYYGKKFVDKQTFDATKKAWETNCNIIAYMPADRIPEPYNPDHIVDANKKVEAE